MKKRSSNGLMTVGTLAFFSLVVILSYLMRTVSIPSTYGAVDVDIPIMEMALNLAAHHQPEHRTTDAYFAGGLSPHYPDATKPPLRKNQPIALDDKSPMVFLTDTTVYFGRLTAFTSQLSATHNKFSFKVAGVKDFPRFAKTFSTWQSKVPGLAKGAVVVVPARSASMDNVIHLVAALKGRPDVERVVLGGGLL